MEKQVTIVHKVHAHGLDEAERTRLREDGYSLSAEDPDVFVHRRTASYTIQERPGDRMTVWCYRRGQ